VIRLRVAALVRIGAERGWVHQAGRFAGSLHVRRVAQDIGLSAAAVSRAYAGGTVGPLFVARVLEVTGAEFGDLFVFDVPARAAS